MALNMSLRWLLTPRENLPQAARALKRAFVAKSANLLLAHTTQEKAGGSCASKKQGKKSGEKKHSP